MLFALVSSFNGLCSPIVTRRFAHPAFLRRAMLSDGFIVDHSRRLWFRRSKTLRNSSSFSGNCSFPFSLALEPDGAARKCSVQIWQLVPANWLLVESFFHFGGTSVNCTFPSIWSEISWKLQRSNFATARRAMQPLSRRALRFVTANGDSCTSVIFGWPLVCFSSRADARS